MSDNIDVTPGTGKTIAADDVGGVLFQRVKMTFGADGSAVDVSAAAPVPVSVGGGLGDLTAVPAGSANGTALGVKPANAVGVRFYLGATDTITFTILGAAPASAPSPTVTISGSNGPSWDENLSGQQQVYVTAITGTPAYRWY